MNPPAAAIVTATKTDSFPDPDNDGKAEPGQTITYDVNVSNTGASDATGVNFTDTIDPNTTFVPGSLRVSPLAFADAYNATKDIALSIPAPGVLANDTGTPAPSAQPIAAGATAQGGSVTLNADGSFTYTPPAGFEGADTFTYTATNGLSPNDTATVTVNVDAGPAVTTTSPANGATSVARNSNITVNFTEPVNATTNSFSVQCPTGSPQTFTLSASPAASFTLDPTADLPAGTTCTVTVTASQITDADTFDPPDQMAADYVFSFGVKIEAVDDMHSATGNVRINTAASGFSVLTNDDAPGAIITAFDAASAHGGEVTMNPTTGTFTYNPPRGFTGVDTFNYTITSPAGSDTGTVVLTVSDMIWFVNNAPGACVLSCDGRLTNPFTSLAAFEAINGDGATSGGAVIDPEAGDNIFLYTGSGNYAGPLTLENSQRVIGQGAVSSITTLAVITLAPDSDALPSTGGAAPVITSAGNGINLAQTNSIHGLSVANTTGTGIGGTGVDTLTISENVTVSNTTTAGVPVQIDGGTLNVEFLSISAGNNTADPDPANGIVVSGTTTGTFTVTGTGTTDGSGGTIQSIANRGASFVNTASGLTVTLKNMVFNNVGTTNGADPTVATGTCGDLVVGSNTGCNAGIHLVQIAGATLDNVDMSGGNQQGINGNGVTNFSLVNSNVLNFGNQIGENGVKLKNLLGTSFITNSTISGNQAVQIEVRNDSGTLNKLDVSGSTISNSSGPNGSHGILFNMRGTATGQLQVQGGTAFANLFSNCIETLGNGSSGGMQVVVIGSTFNGCGASGINIVQSGAAAVRFNISNNGTNAAPTFLGGNSSHAINVNQASTGIGPFEGAITNNFIGNNTSPTSSTVGGNGINIATVSPGGAVTVLVQGNVVRGVGLNGINAQMGNATATAAHKLNLTLLNNQAFVTSPAGFDGVRIQAGTATNHRGTLCAEIKGNTGSSTPSFDFTARQRFLTTIQLRGYTGANNDNVAVQNHLDVTEANTGTDWNITNNVVGLTAGGGFVNTPGGAACAQPSVPALALNLSPDSAQREQLASNAGDNAQPAAPRVWSDMAPASGSAAYRSAADGAAYVGALGATRRPARTVKAGYERPASYGKQTGTTAPAKAAAFAARASAALFSGETVNASIGTLPAGKTVHIAFQVTVDNPFTGATPQVSNQGTITADGGISVQTDDPSVGGSADKTVTPILTPPTISVKDASVAEPATGSATAAFAVTLSHAYTHTVTVDFGTADDTGLNAATAGSDYTTTSGEITFNPGETVQTVSVSVLADADDLETAETFLVNLSNNSANSSIADGQAEGTITPDSTPGTVVISELRTSGPAGAGDDFVELYNNTDSPITVAASDASGGWALVKSGGACGDTPVVLAVIPAGTVIPARGNYLLVGSAYSLGAYAAGDQTLALDIEDDRNVALFNTADLSNVSTETRLDAVGFGANVGNNCDLLREGATLAAAQGSTSEYSFVRKVDKGATLDTNDNAADFVVVSTTAGPVGSNAAPRLGAPGPENSAGARGPVPCNVTSSAKFGRDRLDSTAALGSAPNTVRDATVLPNAANGTIDFRRRFTNNTGGAVTQLRFRITNLKNPPAPGTADLRALTSGPVVVSGVNDTITCGGATPCSVTVQGTTLEQPPAQGNGGGVNSSLGVGTINLGTPLASGASVNLHLLFGVQQAGDYHVSLVIETATTGQIGQDVWELRGHTENGGHTDGGCNTPPVADAGEDQTVECAGALTSVTLDGTGSTDADGDTLTYEWREGATVLGTTETLNTSLPFGPHTVTLKVTDPSGDFSEDTVSVNVADTADPMITPPANVSVSTGPGATSCGAFVSDETLGEATASDGCSASVIITRTGVPAGNIFPVGTTKVTYTADDGHGHTKEAYQFVTVTDNTPPTVTAPANIEVNAPANSCSVNLDPGTATAGDNCPGVAVAGVRSDSQPLNAPYPVGITTITWTATDASNNTATAVQTVKVNDVTPPVITLTLGAISLSPPNHAYQTFSITDLVASASDGCDAGVDINDVVISQATSDEPENANGNGDGNTLNDIVIAPDCKSLQLRSERDGGGDGRVYTITLRVKDSSGNVATAVRKVFVPRSGPAVDSGTQYTVNGCNP